ncbi:transposase family protein [Streptomyces sp. IB201691-2A2]|uniref:transposase family protein n=1 Tax=Streptomyces sp. IB201691-2A2 TaxID=2561920 RepID=UPI0021B131D8|nr:transposase family protein [Streptomyces sp. IB201691-2A2]
MSGLLPALPGTSRFRLPPASTALLRQGDGGGLSPPLEQRAPHGAHSGKHKTHGLLFLALTDEKGNLIWISAAKPGRSSEITTARHNKITGHLREAGLGALADLGFVGLDDKPDDDPVIITGRKATRNHQLTAAEKETHRLVSRERAANEHGFANLKSWRTLTKLRTDTRQATTLLRALLVLANSEVQR